MTAALVVGAGQAGVQLSASLRDLGFQGPVTLVGLEPHIPYQRPPLSKAFLLGNATEASMALRSERFFRDNDITLRTGARVRSLSVLPLGGGVARTSDDDELSFDLLFLTTGAAPRRLELPGAECTGVHYLRGLEDARTLRAAFTTAHKVVVIGAGYVGLEAAAVASTMGKEVAVVEAAANVLARVATPILSDFYRSAHERRGVTFHLGSTVTEILGSNGAVCGVRLADGHVSDADLVLVGVGATPCVELAMQCGARCTAEGINVDEYARTSVPGVFAAGDCTAFPSPFEKGELIHLESVQNAIDQAKVAASTALGIMTPYRDIPWFWSDQGDLKLQMAGHSKGCDDVIVRGEVGSERFSIIHVKNGRFMAISSVNRAADYVAGRIALTEGRDLDLSRVHDAEVPLKQLVLANHAEH